MRNTSILLLFFLGACAPVPVDRKASVGSEPEPEDGDVPADGSEPTVHTDASSRPPPDAGSPSPDGPAPSPDRAPPPPDIAPAPTPMLSNLLVNDMANAAKWSLQKNLRMGDTVFGDRSYMFATVSDNLVGKPWVRAANLSKTFAMDPLATFEISVPGLIMVAMDMRAPMPSWLMDWTPTGDELTYVDVKNATVVHKVFTKEFPAGMVSLGPIMCPTQDCNTYVVVVGPGAP